MIARVSIFSGPHYKIALPDCCQRDRMSEFEKRFDMNQLIPRVSIFHLLLMATLICIGVSNDKCRGFVIGSTKAKTAGPASPSFAIKVSGQPLKIYSTSYVSNKWITANVSQHEPGLNPDHWELRITLKDHTLTEIWFPW